jgi:hypothetical protein
MIIATALFGALIAGFGVFFGITEVDVAFFLFGGLFPVLIALAAPAGRNGSQDADPFGPLEEDERLVRALVCASAEIVGLTMAWSRMIASEFLVWSRSHSGTTGSTLTAGAFKGSGVWREFEFWSITFPERTSLVVLSLFAVATTVVLVRRRFPRSSQAVVLWHLLMWAILQAWFYSLHSRVFA